MSLTVKLVTSTSTLLATNASRVLLPALSAVVILYALLVSRIIYWWLMAHFNHVRHVEWTSTSILTSVVHAWNTVSNARMEPLAPIVMSDSCSIKAQEHVRKFCVQKTNTSRDLPVTLVILAVIHVQAHANQQHLLVRQVLLVQLA